MPPFDSTYEALTPILRATIQASCFREREDLKLKTHLHRKMEVRFVVSETG